MTRNTGMFIAMLAVCCGLIIVPVCAMFWLARKAPALEHSAAPVGRWADAESYYYYPQSHLCGAVLSQDASTGLLTHLYLFRMFDAYGQVEHQFPATWDSDAEARQAMEELCRESAGRWEGK